MKRFKLLFGLFLLLGLVATVFGAVPQLINFQGILKDGSGNPVTNGSYSVTFTIYDTPAGGSVQWAETTSVTTTSGLFSVLLGSLNPVPDTAVNNPNRWMGIKVGADPEMTPRQQLVSVAYGFRIGSVDGASGGTITSKVSIGPGHTNTGADAFVAGNGNTASGDLTTVGGGGGNIASNLFATVGGGGGNNANGFVATVSGGRNNTASGSDATVGGGQFNNASGSFAVVDGGQFNNASDNAAVGGGINNVASGSGATVGGGAVNTASGLAGTIGGGQNNNARGQYTVVAGGGGATPADSNSAQGDYSTIGGGSRNIASGGSATVGGGARNTANGDAATVGGGGDNTASGFEATIGGGGFNAASGELATVSGGSRNTASGVRSTVGGGEGNAASGYSATVPGGSGCNATGNFSLAAGRQGKALHDGTFVWGDATDAPFSSTAINQFLIRASGGVGIGTNSPTSAAGGQVLHINNGAGASALRLGDDAVGGKQWEIQSTIIGTGALNFSNVSDGSNPMTILANGNVGIGSTAPTEALHVVGNICGTGGVFACSDARYKTNRRKIPDALNKVEGLNGIFFNWKRDEFPAMGFKEGNQVGFVAQELKQVLPEAVSQGSDGYYSVDYGRLTPLLVEAIKEQQKQIEELKDRISELEKEKSQAKIDE